MSLSISERLKLEQLARQILTPDEITQAGNVCSGMSERVYNTLFKLQSDIINDPCRWKILLAGRRSSKSFIMASHHIITCLDTPNIKTLYLSITRQSAKEIIWDTILELNENLSLCGIPNNADLTITFPSKSTILLGGCDNQREMGKHRGKKYRLVTIDECQDFGPHLKELIDGVLTKTMYDYGDAVQLYLAGTPNATCTGHFYDLSEKRIEDKYKKWHWTVRENERLPQWAGKVDWEKRADLFLAAEKEQHIREGKIKTFQRETLGQWIRDTEILTFDFDDNRNIYMSLPDGDYTYAIGIDVGFVDDFAVVVGCWNNYDGILYICDAFSKPQTLTSEKGVIINKYKNQYNPISISVDSGGGGKQLIEDLNYELGLNLEPAIKPSSQKGPDLQRISDQMSVGKIQIHSSLIGTISQVKKLQWKDKSKWELDDKFPRHQVDSILYLVRKASHFYTDESRRPQPPPTAEEEAAKQHRLVIEESRRQEEYEDMMYF